MIKKIIFFAIGLFLHIEFILGQNWYSGINGGYSFGLPSQNITSNINIGSNQTSNSVVKGSFGQGASIDAYLGYWLKNHIGIELGLSYLQSSSFKGSYSQDTVFKQDLTISANMLRAAPALRLTLGEEDSKTNLFLKVGFVTRLAGKITNETTVFDIQSNTTTISETKYSKGFSFGAMAGIGFCYKIKPQLKIFSELSFISQSWAPKNGDVVKYTVNGVDQMDVLNSGNKHIHFVDSYNAVNTAQSTSVPSQELKQYHNFSSVGLKLGVLFAFGKKK
jgi:hypothetical protein